MNDRLHVVTMDVRVNSEENKIFSDTRDQFICLFLHGRMNVHQRVVVCVLQEQMVYQLILKNAEVILVSNVTAERKLLMLENHLEKQYSKISCLSFIILLLKSKRMRLTRV